MFRLRIPESKHTGLGSGGWPSWIFGPEREKIGQLEVEARPRHGRHLAGRGGGVQIPEVLWCVDGLANSQAPPSHVTREAMN